MSEKQAEKSSDKSVILSEIKRLAKKDGVDIKAVRDNIKKITSLLQNKEAELEDSYDEYWVTLGENLYLAQSKRLYLVWGYSTFAQFIKNSVPISERKVYYIKCAYKRFFTGERSFNLQAVKKIGWTKISKIAESPFIKDDDLEQTLEKAKNMSVVQLVGYLDGLSNSSKPKEEVKSFNIGITKKSLKSFEKIKQIFKEQRGTTRLKNSDVFNDTILTIESMLKNKTVLEIFKREIARER